VSMIMQYVRIRGDELVTLRRLLSDDGDKAYEYVDELADAETASHAVPAEQSRSIDTDKSWDGLSFLLKRVGPAPVDVVHGGAVLTSDEWGYGPPRYLSPDEVSRAAAHLDGTPFYRLAEHFDPAAMTEVYPRVWDSDDALTYLRGWYEPLTRFFKHAAAERDGMVIYLT
jgi:hypothetical protein